MTIGFIAFLLVSIITTATTIYYYQEYTSANLNYDTYYQKYLLAQQNYTSIRESVIQISITIDYGNGTAITNDAVYLPLNTTVFDTLKAVANVNATYWEAYQSYFINSINNVVTNKNSNNRWWVFSVNGEYALVSAENYRLHDGDRIEWIYQQY